MDKKQKIFDLLNSQDYGVLSTVSTDQKPESAVMMITVLPNNTILMGTKKESRKHKNLNGNSNVSVIVWNGWTEAQLEGIAEIVEGSEPGFAELKDNLLKRHSDADTRIDEKTVFILIKPTWARYSALGQKPPEIFEITDWSLPD
ncbi:hypothetical protein A3D00_03645 [Candidatus Woesebacteria bacterium RIFCSPHIGHO2_02_FULL_38_9]|uniref:Pyridoxamine 5'-phosphate oxidase N-terminal domain-containing protein n=1 Tax=Candidatus Woesebacteria bacterium RIFCSPHIGHO2_01_FULL_39_28 TaxID=1802496 RepID=A0A1F7YI66_9BACT|nr:MAG: hypothetical protein A2627_00970 [Candidatus Woesebacteria bacterium RIFCSPHIGHO2_01_FULL_39_28]OGM32588.1 MAG: hypothetical protein A3D00_03645 [Candidatus Woesebacteria bacterium RIFCSPHIGHO2_02_FULL_38_9]OGM58712.1 MAG: hypothetical protein A3A50_02890 [Candidatus Woesebacteria bacterium RIFCSPLOWO2_01_FULL_38_20]